MSIPKAGNPARRIAKAVNAFGEIERQLDYAIAVHQMLTSLWDNQVLGTAVVNRGLNLVQRSLWFELVLTITRLYDKDTRTASFRNVIPLVRDPVVQEHLCDPKAANSATRAYDKLSQQSTSVDRMARLFKLRDKVLAHTDMTPVNHDTNFGDAEKILRHSVTMGAHLTKAFTGRVSLMPKNWKNWQTTGSDFWARFHLDDRNPRSISCVSAAARILSLTDREVTISHR
jgi:hypothetical protein